MPRPTTTRGILRYGNEAWRAGTTNFFLAVISFELAVITVLIAALAVRVS